MENQDEINIHDENPQNEEQQNNQEEPQQNEQDNEQNQEVEEQKNDPEPEPASLREKLQNCIQLMRKLPVSKQAQNVDAITNLIYEEDELLNEFLQKIDQPAVISKEDMFGFLKCEYNRDGDSHRSPNNNKYYPQPEEGEELRFPDKNLREFEEILNRIFKEYTKLYYSNIAICSCFVWLTGETIEEGLCISVVIKHDVTYGKKLTEGCWDSSNLVGITFSRNSEDKLVAKYKLTTTVMVNASISEEKAGVIHLSGALTKMAEGDRRIKSHLDHQDHVETIGEMIERVETDLRNVIEERYIKKTKEIIDTARYSPVLGKPNVEGAEKLKGVFKG